MKEIPEFGRDVLEVRTPDGRFGHLVPDEHGAYQTFVEPFSRWNGDRLTPDQQADLTMQRRGQGKKPPKYD